MTRGWLPALFRARRPFAGEDRRREPSSCRLRDTGPPTAGLRSRRRWERVATWLTTESTAGAAKCPCVCANARQPLSTSQNITADDRRLGESPLFTQDHAVLTPRHREEGQRQEGVTHLRVHKCGSCRGVRSSLAHRTHTHTRKNKGSWIFLGPFFLFVSGVVAVGTAGFSLLARSWRRAGLVPPARFSLFRPTPGELGCCASLRRSLLRDGGVGRLGRIRSSLRGAGLGGTHGEVLSLLCLSRNQSPVLVKCLER